MCVGGGIQLHQYPGGYREQSRLTGLWRTDLRGQDEDLSDRSYKDGLGERSTSPLWHWLRAKAKGHRGPLAAPSSLGALHFAHLCLFTENPTVSMSLPHFAFSSKTRPLDPTPNRNTPATLDRKASRRPSNPAAQGIRDGWPLPQSQKLSLVHFPAP